MRTRLSVIPTERKFHHIWKLILENRNISICLGVGGDICPAQITIPSMLWAPGVHLEDEGSWLAEDLSQCQGEYVEEMAHQPQEKLSLIWVHLPHIFVCISPLQATAGHHPWCPAAAPRNASGDNGSAVESRCPPDCCTLLLAEYYFWHHHQPKTQTREL